MKKITSCVVLVMVTLLVFLQGCAVNKSKDKDSDVRSNAAEALVKIGTPAVEPLIAGLKDEDVSVRKKAAEALKELNWSPKNQEEQVDYLLAQQQYAELVKIGGPAVPSLISVLKDSNWRVRWQAIVALGEIKDPRAVEPLFDVLKDEDSGVRRMAVKTLGEIKDPRAAGPLIIALKDKDPNVRETAAEMLGKMEYPLTIDVRILLLLEKRSWDELVKLGELAVPSLISALKSENGKRAAVALGKIGDPRAVAPLIDALKSNNIDVRINAAEALGEIKDARAVGPLIAALKDTKMNIQGSAAWALGEIKTLVP